MAMYSAVIVKVANFANNNKKVTITKSANSTNNTDDDDNNTWRANNVKSNNNNITVLKIYNSQILQLHIIFWCLFTFLL